MGHKTTPNLFRLGTLKTWNSRWFANKDNYCDFIKHDVLIRQFLSEKLNRHSVDKIEIERDGKKFSVIINTAKPGVVIGKNGLGIEELKNKISKILKTNSIVVDVVVKEVKNQDYSAAILLEQAIVDIEKRVPFKKVMKKLIDKAKQAGLKGLKIRMAGRLNGVEIARSEVLSWGSIPLHTIRADIDYVNGVANTIYGTIGIKVWSYKGLVFIEKNSSVNEEVQEETHEEKAQEKKSVKRPIAAKKIVAKK